MAVIDARVSQDGTKSYRVRVRVKGAPTVSKTFVRLTDARRWAQKTENELREGLYFQTPEEKKHTVADLIDRYLSEEFPTKTLRSGKDRLRHLEWWKRKLGHLALIEVSQAVIVATRNELGKRRLPSGEKIKPGTVNRYMASLSRVFSLASQEWEWMKENPCSRISRWKEPRGRVRFLSDDERERLLAACRASRQPLIYPIVVLAISTGARRGEIVGLKRSDLDLEREQIALQETKNGERRVVPVKGLALQLVKERLAAMPKSQLLLFAGRANSPIDIKKSWNKALKEAGIEDFRFHDLRHTAASYLAMNGARLGEIAEILGHKTLQMVKRYAHLTEAHTAGVVASMNRKIFGG